MSLSHVVPALALTCVLAAATTVAAAPPPLPKKGASLPHAPWPAPTLKAGEGTTELYVDPKPLTRDSALGVAVGHDTPEAALMAFYASRMRGDYAWMQAIVPGLMAKAGEPEPSEATKRILGRLAGQLMKQMEWSYHRVELVSRTPSATPGGYWIKVRMLLVIDFVVDEGTDDAELIPIDGRWYVAGVPI